MRHWRLVCTVVAVAAFSAVVISQTQSGHALFEQALAKERVEGNLPEAIKLFERVVTEFASDRALAARALVQIGLSYEKLGRDEAVRAYERLVRDFADQEDAADQARARLAAIRRLPQGAVATALASVRAFPRVDSLNLVLSLSPDGAKATFGNVDKGQNIGVYDVATQRTMLITDHEWSPDGSYAFSPAWSPDGRRIAHGQCPLKGGTCELRIATLGGASEVIVRDPVAGMIPAGWLPDGSALIVTVVRTDRTAFIALVPVTGGPFTQLRSVSGWTGRYPETASVSPDGRLIAFSEGSQGMRDVHVISRDGQMAYRITDHPADDHQPLWSPDGRHLAFLSNRHGSVALWTVTIRDGQPAGEPVRIKDAMQDVVDLVGWTTRGLAYSSGVRTEDIFMMPVNRTSGEPGGSVRQIPYRRTGRNVAPVWSPDGRYLAFISSSAAEPDRRTLVLLPSGSGEPREFSIPPLQAMYDVRWFGDGSGLGFSGYDVRGAITLFRLTLASGEWKTFPLPVTNMTRIEWNGDGSRIFYARSDFGPDDPAIVERDLQSDRERVVFRGGRFDRYRGLRFSPDRRSLAFRGISDQQAIVVVDLDTGTSRVVHDKAPGDTYTYTAADSLGVPTWSPNGRELLVHRTENPRTNKQTTVLRLIPLDGGEVRPIPLGTELTRLLSPGRGVQRPTIRDLAWSPDGDRLAFVLSAETMETFVIENALALAGTPDARASR